ncbi:MAG: vitamin B12-dependent ribonucleotide reductase [Phycisphaerae bacterium]|nr:vitamin B12-dependent ribonucleotide reductase [Phycisphaerae bacterium]
MVSASKERAALPDKDVGCRLHHEEISDLTPNALRVLRVRYLKKDDEGKCIEAPGDLFDRVAGTIAAVELRYGAGEVCRGEWKARFKRLMTSRRFMPNSPTLMNAGRSMGMLSACFVLPVPDSIDGIFDAIKQTALIQKAGGGTGFAFDSLRPTGDYIKSSGGRTSGPISFWRAFSEATNAIQQGAFRRGANMGMMNIHHPDILKFLHAKQDLTQFTNYNISVKITDEWMQGFLEDEDAPHLARNPRDGRECYLPKDISVHDYRITDLVPVEAYDGQMPVYTRREVWNILVKQAWQTGEPGVVFIDRVNEDNPTPHVGRIEATNPCGEQPLLPYEACNLGSINLGLFVKSACTPEADLDWQSLRRSIHDAVRFLDNVIDANNYPLPQIDDMCKANRKIGLGVMGFADALFKLGVPYNSEEGVAWGGRFMKFLNDEAHNASERLAQERGSFPNWANSHWDTKHDRPMRNSCTTTVAPTGTISIIADCSGGIEPLFSLAFVRNVLKGQDEGGAPMVETNETFERVARERGFYSEGLMEQIARDGTLAHIDAIPDDVKRVFVCAHDIDPVWHIRMQAAFQEHCDASISKTINFRHDANEADVDNIYRTAYALRCKGVTVYRDGCRASQPMALTQSDGKHEQGREQMTTNGDAPRKSSPNGIQPEGAEISTETNLFGERITQIKKPVPALDPKELPSITSGVRIRQQTPFGNMHIQITVDPREERELEVFAQLGKGGDIATSDLEAICRMISLWLRAGGRITHVIKQLSGIGSSLQIPTRHGRIMSLGDGLAHALKRYTRAKERHGLKALLLGEIDPEHIEGLPGGGSNGGNGKNGRGGDITIAAANRLAETSPKLMSPRHSYRIKCPECGEDLDTGENCVKCHGCGYAQC